MAYDQGLAERLRDELSDIPGVTEKNMFGGLCLMVRGNMCCGIVNDTLMARVGPKQYAECLDLPHVREMDFTGKPLRGMVYVDPDGIAEDSELRAWVNRCLLFTQSLPAK
jgi:TfoX/Sxy family transcriptional regulator of competence genes